MKMSGVQLSPLPEEPYEMEQAKKKLIVIIGTTGAGKTKLSLEVAKAFNGEIINSDAMQMYRGLDIATAKATTEEQQLARHHLLNVLAPEETCTVMDYQKLAKQKIEQVHARGKLPVVIGGTNFYVQSLLWPDELLAECPASQHAQPEETGAQQLDPQEAYQQLQALDPVMANRLHPNDTRRVLRSLEIYRQTGKKQSELIAEQQATSKAAECAYDACILWTNCVERDVLHQRLNDRVDKMVQDGLVQEISSLQSHLKQMNAMPENWQSNSTGILQAIGFKEFAPYFEIKDTGDDMATSKCLHECLEQLKTSTRQYARRQVTWIRNRILRRNVPVYEVDTSDASTWAATVSPVALSVVSNFLADTKICIQTAQEKLQVQEEANPAKLHDWKKFYCEVCNQTLNGEKEYQIHLNTRKHKRRFAKHKQQTKEMTTSLSS